MNIPKSIFELVAGLPGEEFVVPALNDLRSDKSDSVEVLLLLIAKSRLVEAGFDFLAQVDPPQPSTERCLYEELGNQDPENAYQNYNSLKRRLDSFIRALEMRVNQLVLADS